MAIATTETRALAQQGAEALRRGDASGARDAFRRATEAFPNDPKGWFGLAHACRALKDADAMLAALEHVIALEPSAWRAFLMKADHLTEIGDGRAASMYYAAALRRAPEPQSLPPEAQRERARAQAMHERHLAEYDSFLRSRLPDKGSARFAQSLDLMLGKKQVYLQQPLYYYFPGLPQIQFYEREQFPWLAGLEAETASIRAELIEIMKDTGAFAPYVEGDPNNPQQDHHGMLNNPNWSAFYLIRNGTVVSENAARCPRTLAAVQKAPLTAVKNRTPSVMFSRLLPGARIPPHHGFINVRLICHLGLIVPPKCQFRVGNDIREWQEGKAWVFDDTMEHEAWNQSDQTRVILLFDIWRPELLDDERRSVAAMFGAIDAHGGKQGEWNF